MNHDEAQRAAHRAANAVMMLPRQQSWLCQALGWPPECHADLVSQAAEHVRAHPDAPAEALYLELRGEKTGPWSEAKPHVRAAFEVFRGSLLACDKLVEREPRAAPAPAWLTEQDAGLIEDVDGHVI